MKKQNPRQSKSQSKENSTSWSQVSSWYHDLLETDTDSYQAQVILPQLRRLLGNLENKRVLDLACGQGYFTRALKEKKVLISGVDISASLIRKAKALSSDIVYTVSNASNLPYEDNSFDKIFSILAFQNIDPVPLAFAEAFRVLKKDGEFILVLNHPAFRIPQYSDWIYNKKNGTQERTIAKYLSEIRINIKMHPGKNNKVETLSFHRPLQYWFKCASKAGFVITRLEEWESHKQSQMGPKKQAEDRARKEIPLFMAIVFRKL